MKNSWQYDLIDHMGNLIKDESTGQRGINFQKASCTLDASVKIYSNRVDDTHASSHRILESLSRTYTDGDGEGPQRGTARVGSKNASNKLNIAETIEKDVKNLNAVAVDTLQATDPMFHKMSKAFDDGGAKGMLMANLRVSQDECSLVFAASQLPIEEQRNDHVLPSIASAPAAVASTGCVDISDLIFKCGFDATSLLSLTVCPALEAYRGSIGITETSAGCFDTADYPSYFPAGLMQPPSQSHSLVSSVGSGCGSGGGAAPMPVQNDHQDAMFDGGADAYDDGDDENDYGGNDDFGGADFGDEPFATASAAARTSMSAAVARRSSTGTGSGAVQGQGQDGGHKIQWLSDAAALAAEDAPAVEEGALNAVVWDSAGITSTNDYSFFDLDVVHKSNSWAGARHWKYATRRQVAAATVGKLPAAVEEGEEEDDAGEVAEEKKKKVAKKDKFVFDFSGEWVSEELFAVPASKARSNTTCLTAAALEKDSAVCADGGLFLPPDAKLQTSDLCRLMMCGNIIVPPPMLAPAFIKQANAASSSSRVQRTGRAGLFSSTQGPDVIWGQVRQVAAPPGSTFAGGFGQAQRWNNNDDGGYDAYDDDNDGGDFGEDFCDADGDCDAGRGEPATAEPEGLYINTDALLRAPRTVEKIDIGFATVAKRVNVKKLKIDIWSHIDELQEADVAAEGADADDGENQSPNVHGKRASSDGKAGETETMSFQELVCDIANEQKQREVTLPFYFICLLHLANEKTLKIEGSPDMNDLIISKAVVQ